MSEPVQVYTACQFVFFVIVIKKFVLKKIMLKGMGKITYMKMKTCRTPSTSLVK